MLDLDHFKIFNDTHGHQNGDLVLQELGRLLEKQFRSGDIACRYGGEEFLVIMPGTTLKDASSRADEVRLQFEKISFQTIVQRQTHVTLSGGVSVFPDNGLDSEEIINCADQALYRAKKSGRNRVSIYSG
jgi:diguanylate cyclase (GGDEF)-like protein